MFVPLQLNEKLEQLAANKGSPKSRVFIRFRLATLIAREVGLFGYAIVAISNARRKSSSIRMTNDTFVMLDDGFNQSNVYTMFS